MINTKSVTGRRELSFATLDEFIQDAETLAAGEYRTLGNWTFGQILGHLEYALRASIDGFPFKAPWLVRTFIAPLVKNSALTKPLKPGFKLPKSAASYLPDESTTVEEALAGCKKTVERLSVETPNAVHPFFGAMASEEWMALHLRHAEMHMSFVVPAESDAGE